MQPMEKKTGAYNATYVFSTEQQEVKRIYQKYSSWERKPLSEEEEKMAQLRRLDRSVTRAGTIAAILTGIGGAAVHGIGIAMVQGAAMFALGTVVAIVGLALFLVSYPVFCAVEKKRRRKVEVQILKLCKELMK